jgi:nicotinate-nucleotide--dimethylbenzimidazole phosphoribosyltransferase
LYGYRVFIFGSRVYVLIKGALYILLGEIIDQIGDLNGGAMIAARERQSNLTKPPGSLGVLEDIAVKIAGIMQTPLPTISGKAVLIMAGDHGVVEEGVSAWPSDVTVQMLQNFVHGGAAINVLARHAGAKVVVVDVGVKAQLNLAGVASCKVRPGTANITLGAAMTREEAMKAIQVGFSQAQAAIDQGANLLATGDMGIGNTTPSSAILAAFSSMPVAKVIGRGTGVNDNGLQKKISAIEKALAVNKPDPRDALDVLSKVGGLEIAAIAGVILGGASCRVPVLIDGFISGAGALVAAKLAPKARNFMLASHLSEEPGHHYMLQLLDLSPILRMRMRLGEGTGAVLAMPVVEAACNIHAEMATFQQAGVAEKI